jgi:hypothetical protein
MEQLGQGGGVGDRAVLIQRALIDLIDFFDPMQIRFPDVNERGEVPTPLGVQDRKRLRPLVRLLGSATRLIHILSRVRGQNCMA